jgi:4-hydroxy-3-methylbut-2-enyl diphosphate reductase IspH
MKRKLVAGILVLVLVATAIGAVSAQNNFGVQSHTMANQCSGSQCLMNQLNDQQQQELCQQTQERQQISNQCTINCQVCLGLCRMNQSNDQQQQELCQQTQERQQISNQCTINCQSCHRFVDEDGERYL